MALVCRWHILTADQIIASIQHRIIDQLAVCSE